MNWYTLEVYIRENAYLVTGVVMGVCLLLILLQVTRTRREVHKICKKIRRYFDVVLKEEDTAEVIEPVKESVTQAAPLYEIMADYQKEQLKKQKDAELLMEVISEVF